MIWSNIQLLRKRKYLRRRKKLRVLYQLFNLLLTKQKRRLVVYRSMLLLKLNHFHLHRKLQQQFQKQQPDLWVKQTVVGKGFEHSQHSLELLKRQLIWMLQLFLKLRLMLLLNLSKKTSKVLIMKLLKELPRQQLHQQNGLLLLFNIFLFMLKLNH